MSHEEALRLVQRLTDAAATRDVSRVIEFYASDAVVVSPVFGEVSGRDAIAATWKTLFSTVADLSIEISDVLIDRDRVAVLSKLTVVAPTGWFGAPAGAVDYRLVLLLSVRDGHVIRDERIYDSIGIGERLEKTRLDKELRTAAEVQRALMCQSSHASSFSKSAGDSIPCRAIGGDFFEFVDLPSGEVGIAIGDIAGKGPAAALLAAMIQGMLAAELVFGGSPAAILSRINRTLVARGICPRFATMVYGVLSPDGQFVYSNAGHNLPILRANDRTHRLAAGGPILGAFRDAVFAQERILLEGGETLVLFTDGVTEARNPRDEEFGEERLLACVAENRSDPRAVLYGILQSVQQFCEGAEQSDDVTVTVTRFLSQIEITGKELHL